MPGPLKRIFSQGRKVRFIPLTKVEIEANKPKPKKVLRGTAEDASPTITVEVINEVPAIEAPEEENAP